jgi:hypothetical protein
MLYIQDLVKGTGITLYDILGRIVFSQIATNENETINTRQLPTGSYVLQLTYPDGTKNIVKVLKE